ncbi:MAG: adenine deaminase, partial [Microvirga sp.]
MTRLTRFAVAPLHSMTRRLADVASARVAPDLVVTGARVLSTYSERIHASREVWITGGRIAAAKPAGAAKKVFGDVPLYDAAGGIIAPGLVDPH